MVGRKGAQSVWDPLFFFVTRYSGNDALSNMVAKQQTPDKFMKEVMQIFVEAGGRDRESRTDTETRILVVREGLLGGDRVTRLHAGRGLTRPLREAVSG